MTVRTHSWLMVAAIVILLLSSCSQTIKYVCPSLSAVPNSTLDALEATGRKDPSTAAWVVDLDKHYQKCDAVGWR